MILIGAWQTQPVFTSFALIAVVLAAVYVLRLFQGAMHGPLRVPAQSRAGQIVGIQALDGKDGMFDLAPREFWLVVPLLAVIFFLGIWPAWLNDRVPSNANGAPQAAVSERV